MRCWTYSIDRTKSMDLDTIVRLSTCETLQSILKQDFDRNEVYVSFALW